MNNAEILEEIIGPYIDVQTELLKERRARLEEIAESQIFEFLSEGEE